MSHLHRKRKRSKTDREIPHELDVFLPESRLYSQLLNFQTRVDADLNRHYIVKDDVDNQAKSLKPKQTSKILRIFLSNSHENQDIQESENLGEEPRWTFRIQGQLLDPQSLTTSRMQPHLNFSNVVKKVVIQFDPNILSPPLATVEWLKQFSPALADGLEVKRNGSENCNTKISVYLDHCPEHHKLSPPLANIVNLKQGSRSSIIVALWKHIQEHRLQTENDPTKITPSEGLAELLDSKDDISVYEMWNRLSWQHLLPPDPLVFQFEIRTDVSREETATVYDIPIQVPDPPYNYSSQNNGQLQISKILKDIHMWSNRREFLRSFSEAPTDVIRFAINSRVKNTTELSDYYCEPWVPDAVDRFLSEKDREEVQAASSSSSSSWA